GWMRTQQGTTSLRAMFYMDEIYGYLPPTAMPPSKKPLMILLKQARAFGLGILLATQNPADLDYKALANIGTWWLGRLQTERDKMRVLEGVEGAANTAGGKFDRQLMEQTLAGLGNRVFLMNNVHEEHPVVFTVRWLMSYLSGPLSRPQIKALMDPIRPKAGAKTTAAAEDDGFAPPGASSATTTDRNTLRPRLPDGATELFQPSDDDGERLTYTPTILRSATVMFDDAKRKISGRSIVTLVNEIDIEKQKVLWDKFIDVPKDDDLSKYESEPKENAAYADLPGPALKTTTYTSIKKDFTDWVFANHSLELFFSPLLEAYSNPGEKQDEFKVRLSQATREQRDAAVEELRTKTAKAMKSLQDKAEKAASKVDVQQAQSSGAKLSAAVQIGGSILGAIFGRKTSLVKASTISSASRAWKEGADVKAAEHELDSLKADIAELEKQIADDTQKIRDQYDPATLTFEPFKLSPAKKNIQVTATGILWLAK
ncbi:MAG: uncharacterized protein JWR15_3440, partial [Prosthecobacter sp.]|nr:uncharacterized protein [Prosthecobacter sp.]